MKNKHALTTIVIIILLSAFFIVFGGVCYFYGFYEDMGFISLQFGFCSVLYMIFRWLRQLYCEFIYDSEYTIDISDDSIVGILTYFIWLSTALASFWWGFFHGPLFFMEILELRNEPPVNTIIFLSLVTVVTWAYHAVVYERNLDGLACFTVIMLFTIVLGIVHINIGICFSVVCFIRAYLNFLKAEKYFNFKSVAWYLHFNFESVAWYSHFVDVLWLFLFIMSIYYPGAEIHLCLNF